jgi:hypothetical protein
MAFAAVCTAGVAETFRSLLMGEQRFDFLP